MESNRTSSLFAITRLVRENRARTRSDIATQLSMRSTSVSDYVGELVGFDILRESVIKARGRGRPAVALSINTQRLGAILIGVTDHSLVGRAVDLDFRVLAEMSVVPPELCDNDEMGALLRQLVHEVSGHFAGGMEISDIVLSLPGLLDVPRATWCVASRWPNLLNLDIARALGEFDIPLTLVRNLDAELAGIRLSEGHGHSENALLLHWGYGIGAAFSSADRVINHERGRFCEIGHWGLGNAAGRQCTCGNKDCLETVAALWAIGEALHTQVPDLPLNENEMATELRRLDITEVPVIQQALGEVLRVTANLCRLLFPDRIILTGPFAQNPEIFRRFVETIARAPLLKSLDMAQVTMGDSNARHEIAGALAEPFNRSLMKLLSEAPEERQAQG